MNHWLKSIQDEINSVTEEHLAEPEQDMEPHEKMLGTVGAELKKIHYLERLYQSRTIEAMAKSMLVRPYERVQAEAQAHRLTKQAEMLGELFWFTLRDNLNLWNQPSIGIRKGWKVVAYERERQLDGILGIDPADLEGILRRQFGSHADVPLSKKPRFL